MQARVVEGVTIYAEERQEGASKWKTEMELENDRVYISFNNPMTD